ncbi:hypothetical protein SAMN05444172_6067 [Burkholderia sp. GAS332]|uniref:hypothetical protein n=1 Tax=Paraburkholderia sediminicola TaxID=458836 RepID=UPI0009267B08|nr:hypothetical protein SAMN05444172_6067 [Burkholderia sp. GAS332]
MQTRYSYHDAELVGCTYSRTDSVLLLSFECTDGTAPKLPFSEVAAIRANDFSQQNVVSRLLVSPAHAFTPEEIRTYVNWASSQHDYRAAMADDKASTLVSDIAAGKFILFALEPSIGAEIVTLCKDVREID